MAGDPDCRPIEREITFRKGPVTAGVRKAMLAW
jgi:hypothetical protein